MDFTFRLDLVLFYFIYTGLLHAGIGHNQLNMLLTTMNIRYVHHKSLKRREREAGKFIEMVAKQSTHSALQQECQLARCVLKDQLTMSILLFTNQFY